MKSRSESRRRFLKGMALGAGALVLSPKDGLLRPTITTGQRESAGSPNEPGSADYTLRIQTSPIEIAPNRIISATTYNGQFPGPLLRFKEGQRVTVDVYNDTDTPEQFSAPTLIHGVIVLPYDKLDRPVVRQN